MGQWDEWIYLQWLTNSTSHKLVISPITLQIKRYIYFRSKNIFLIMHENSALMSHGRAVQSSLQGVSGCIVPAGMASGEDMLRTNQIAILVFPLSTGNIAKCRLPHYIWWHEKLLCKTNFEADLWRCDYGDVICGIIEASRDIISEVRLAGLIINNTRYEPLGGREAHEIWMMDALSLATRLQAMNSIDA